jgi:hypothetical protein
MFFDFVIVRLVVAIVLQCISFCIFNKRDIKGATTTLTGERLREGASHNFEGGSTLK